MSTLSKSPKDWTGADLNALVQDAIEENARLEYKEKVNLKASGKKEACKDVSAFANGMGGTIIYGMEEEAQKDLGSIPKGFKPITDASIKETLENVLLSGISPKLSFWMYPIQVKGGCCLVVHTPQSFCTHMVTIGGENRYYIRRNFQSSPMTEDEIKNHYARTLQAKEEADKLYNSRRTKYNDPTKPTAQLITLPLFESQRLIDLPRFSAETFRVSRNAPGFLNKRIHWEYVVRGDEYVAGNDQWFWFRIETSGFCEYNYFPPVQDGKKIFHSEILVEFLHDLLVHCSRVYSSVGYYGPIKVYLRLEKTKNAALIAPSLSSISSSYRDWSEATTEDFNYSLDAQVDEILTDPFSLVSQIMDYVWFHFGYEKRCPFFGEDGKPTIQIGTSCDFLWL